MTSEPSLVSRLIKYGDALIYAANQSCEELAVARKLAESLLADSRDWMLADQVLFEYYRALRNPAILERPLNANQAAKQVRFLKEKAGCLHCAYSSDLWERVSPHLSKASPYLALHWEGVCISLHWGGQVFFERLTGFGLRV